MKIKLNAELRETLDDLWHNYCDEVDVREHHKQIAEYFFLAGYEAAIAERAKFDEQNGLLVKDITEL